MKRFLVEFTGRDGSMGFRKGTVYYIEVEEREHDIIMRSPTYCPYGSWDAFWSNWSKVDRYLDN